MAVCDFQHLWEPIVRDNPGASQEKLRQLYMEAAQAVLLQRKSDRDEEEHHGA